MTAKLTRVERKALERGYKMVLQAAENAQLVYDYRAVHALAAVANLVLDHLAEDRRARGGPMPFRPMEDERPAAAHQRRGRRLLRWRA